MLSRDIKEILARVTVGATGRVGPPGGVAAAAGGSVKV